MDFDGFTAIPIENGGTELIVVPALGAKIASLRMAGREWLWKSDVIPYRTPIEGASYVETADSGSFDECFPTVGPCVVPQSVMGLGGLVLPDHGELWSQAPEVARRDGSLTATWRGRRLAYVLTRDLRIANDGGVTMDYELTNVGTGRMPFLWSSHPLLPLDEGTRIELPEGSRVRVDAQHGIDLGGPLAEHRWPRLASADGEVDLSRPAALGRSYACKLFLDPLEGRAAVVQEGARLEVRFDLAQVPSFGLWVNWGGWTPFEGGTPYRNLAFEPCIGAPDGLDDALGAWKSAHWLPPDQTRRWSLSWTARALR